jgi:hypothetical protein
MFFTGTVTSDANLANTAIDKLLDVIASSAQSAGWTILARRPDVAVGEEGHTLFAGRTLYKSPHRHWRLHMKGTTRVRIREVVLKDHAGAVISFANVAVAANNTEGSTNVASRAIDGNTGTYWQADNSGSTWQFSFDFSNGGAFPNRFESVGTIELTTDTTEHIEGFRVEWSDDGATWRSAYYLRMAEDGGDPTYHFDGLTWTSGETKVFTLDYVGNAKGDMPMRISGERVYLRGPGGGAGREVYVQLETDRNVTTIIQALKLRHAIGFDATQDFDNQPGASTNPYFVPLDRDQIEYWLYINDRRIVAQFRSGTNYNGFYLGFFLPFCLPSEYDFPLTTIGSSASLINVAESSTSHRNFFDPAGGGVYRRWDGSHYSIRHHDDSAFVNDPIVYARARVWPWSVGGTSWNTFLGGGWEGDGRGHAYGHWLDYVERTAQNELPIFPALLLDHNGPGFVGALDGVYCVPGTDLVPGQAVTIGARNFRAFPNCTRRAGNHWCLIEEL